MAQLKKYETLLVNVLLAACVVVFIAGIWAPILTIKKLIFVTSTFSVLSGIMQLAQDGQYGLFLLITAFTLILPCLKFVVLFTAWNNPQPRRRQRRYLEWLSALGKWSMLDVFVVAVLIASVKLGAIVSIEIHYGLYVFALAVLFLMINTQIVRQRLRAHCN